MFIQNQILSLPNHKKIIIDEINNANKIILVVAYVRENGVDIILDKVKNKSVKVLCSLDMGITQLSGIKKLLENEIEVKVYKSNAGTFHPKIWLFEKENKWKMLVGSANLTRAAFIDNVEASILIQDQGNISNALIFFQYLWESDNASPITLKEIQSLQKKMNERASFNSKIAITPDKIGNESDILFEYVKSWIDIPIYKSEGISRLWRGWYIIPDQGYIDYDRIINLVSYLPIIGEKIYIGTQKIKQTDQYQKLIDKFLSNNIFVRKNLKTSPRELFIRQSKNYLLKLGWCFHPIKSNGKVAKDYLCLTDLGEKIRNCKKSEDIKELYTEYFFNFSFNGLRITLFTKKLLNKLGHLTQDEFHYFVTHAYIENELESIVKLVNIYRSLSKLDKDAFDQKCGKYFQKEKEHTAKNVYGNYIKSIKHTISILGWCKGFLVDKNFSLKLNNEK